MVSKISNIVRGQCFRDERSSQGLSPASGSGNAKTVNDQYDVDLNTLKKKKMLEIIHLDLCLVAENAISLFPDGTNYLPLKIHLKIT